MGIAKGALSLLFELKTTEILQGKVGQLGRQTCFVSEAQVGDIAKHFGFHPASRNQENHVKVWLMTIIYFVLWGLTLLSRLTRAILNRQLIY